MLTILLRVGVIGSALLVTSCGQNEPIIELDSWWAKDVAKGTCEDAKRRLAEARALIASEGCAKVDDCPELTRIRDACINFGSNGVVGVWEERFAAELANNPKCKGAKLTRFQRQPSLEERGKSAWTLYFDFIPGSDKQPWVMAQGKTQTRGDGDPKNVADKVCGIVSGQGATLE